MPQVDYAQDKQLCTAFLRDFEDAATAKLLQLAIPGHDKPPTLPMYVMGVDKGIRVGTCP